MARVTLLSTGIYCVLMTSAAMAAVGDPEIMTDHPVYRGELSCSTLDRNIADAYRIFQERYGHEPKTDTDKLVALWSWKSEHYMHSCDNRVYVGTDSPEADKTGWMDSRDCQMTQFSFSFGLCYSVHAQMTALVGHALGDLKRARAPGIPGHVPFEAYVDGRWVLADFTTGLMVFDDEGKPIGLKEIMARVQAKDGEWLNSPKRGGPYKFSMSPFGDHLDGYTELHGNQTAVRLQRHADRLYAAIRGEFHAAPGSRLGRRQNMDVLGEGLLGHQRQAEARAFPQRDLHGRLPGGQRQGGPR